MDSDLGYPEAWTFVNLHGPSSRRGHGESVASMAFDSHAEVHMACSILDLSWRTCARLFRGRRGGRVRCGSSRPGERDGARDGATARARRPRDRATVLRRRESPIDAAAGRGGLQSDAAMHSVAQRDLNLVHGPARMFVGK